jgi:hypothetical protein
MTFAASAMPMKIGMSAPASVSPEAAVVAIAVGIPVQKRPGLRSVLAYPSRSRPSCSTAEAARLRPILRLQIRKIDKRAASVTTATAIHFAPLSQHAVLQVTVFPFMQALHISTH